MNVTAPFVLAYSFDYGQFDSSQMQSRAKSTLGNFLGFVRSSFDGLLENGRALQELYCDCLALSPNGKKVFDDWLASSDFGVSAYLARSAMEIYIWFEKLPERVQRLVRQNVQSWSVSALRQLTKVSADLVKELTCTGKKTAAQVKQHVSKQAGNLSSTYVFQSPAPQLAPGMRITVTGDGNSWNGQSGIIMSSQEDEFWVLFDHTVASGKDVKHLVKADQMQSEVKVSGIATKSGSQEIFTAAEVEQKIQEALAQRDKEKAEEELGRFVEIRDAALKAAKEEMKAAEQYATKMAQKNSELVQQLAMKEREIEELRGLRAKNQQLEERVAQLEKALDDANVSRWGNTFSRQAAKVVNSELEKTIAPLMAEVERLQNLVEEQKGKLSELEDVNCKQQEELNFWRQSSENKFDVEGGESFCVVNQGWNGRFVRGQGVSGMN